MFRSRTLSVFIETGIFVLPIRTPHIQDEDYNVVVIMLYTALSFVDSELVPKPTPDKQKRALAVLPMPSEILIAVLNSAQPRYLLVSRSFGLGSETSYCETVWVDSLSLRFGNQ